MTEWYISVIEIALVLLIIQTGRCENITLTKTNIEVNKAFLFHKYIYNNETKSTKLPNAGFEYSFTLSSSKNENTRGAFYIFLFDTYIVSSFSKLKCGSSIEEGVYFDKGKDKAPITFLDLGLYNRKIEVDQGSFSYSDTIDIEFSGVSKTVFFYCSYNNNQSVSSSNKPLKLELSGQFSFYNKNGFTSAEDFYLINLYFILTVYYALTSVFWLVKMVMNYKNITLVMTIFSIAIPFVIVENIFRLEFFSITKNQGSLSLPLKILAIIFRVIKNTIFRFVFFLLAHKYYKTIPLRSKSLFGSLLALYIASAVLYEIAAMKHDYFAFPFIYFFLAVVALGAINAGIWFILYNQFNKVSKETRIKNIEIIQKEILMYVNIIKYSFIITIAHYVLYLILRLIQDYFIICYLKWVVDLIQQSISIILFSGLLFMIKPRDLLHDSYINEVDLEKSQGGEMHSQPEVHA